MLAVIRGPHRRRGGQQTVDGFEPADARRPAGTVLPVDVEDEKPAAFPEGAAAQDADVAAFQLVGVGCLVDGTLLPAVTACGCFAAGAKGNEMEAEGEEVFYCIFGVHDSCSG
jgi:hypothetical protein